MSPRGPRPLRILCLTMAEERYTNAQQVNAQEIASRLPPERFIITLLSDGSGSAPIGELPHVRLLHLPRRGKALRILLALLCGRFDILFYAGAGLPEAVYLSLPRFLPCRRARVIVPVEGDVRQFDEVAPWIRRRLDRLLRKADEVHPITDYVAETLRARHGRTGTVIPVGVDTSTFHPREGPRAPGPLRVLSVGTVKAWKRPELVRAAAAAFANVQFTWIGEGELREAEARLAPPNLHFFGACERASLPSHYRQADVFLHTSRMEGLPKVILEALASGLPVIAFNDYRPRYLANGGAGFVVGSEEEMVAVLRELLADHDLHRRMGAAARRLAEGYSWDIVAGRWAGIFEREAAIVQRTAS